MTPAERRRKRLERERTVELMVEDGLGVQEIADALETTRTCVHTLMSEMRRDGARLELSRG